MLTSWQDTKSPLQIVGTKRDPLSKGHWQRDVKSYESRCLCNISNKTSPPQPSPKTLTFQREKYKKCPEIDLKTLSLSLLGRRLYCMIQFATHYHLGSLARCKAYQHRPTFFCPEILTSVRDLSNLASWLAIYFDQLVTQLKITKTIT